VLRATVLQLLDKNIFSIIILSIRQTIFQKLSTDFWLCAISLQQLASPWVDDFFWCLMPLSAIFQLYHGDQF
jgi:hypothetical protein